MKIGLDFDGVFCNAGKLLKDGAQKLFGIDLPEDKTTWEDAVEGGILSVKQFNELKGFVFEDGENGIDLEPVCGIDLACRSLLGKGHYLSIITKRDRGVTIAKKFCQKIGIDIPVIGMKPGQSKSSVASCLDVFLDDSIGNLDELKGTIPSLFLFSWSYNHTYDTNLWRRVHSWEEFVQQIG